jgi:hypothetical protein
VGFSAITLCVASQRVFIVVSEYFFMDSVRKLLDTPSYIVGWVTKKIIISPNFCRLVFLGQSYYMS